MFHEVTVNALGGFIGGLALTAITSLFSRSAQTVSGTSATYNNSQHNGNNITNNQRITVSPSIINQARQITGSSTSSRSTAAPTTDDALWATLAIALVAVSLYAQHQQALLAAMGTAYAAALAFLAGCLTFLLAHRVRLDRRMVIHCAIVALSIASLWFVPRLARTAPLGGNLKDSLGTVRRIGVVKAATTDSALVLFPLVQLAGLVLAVLAMITTLRFGLSVLAHCRLARLDALGKNSTWTAKLLTCTGSTGHAAAITAITTLLSLLTVSGAAWSGGNWLETKAQNTILAMTATASAASNGGTSVCLEATSQVGLSPKNTYTLQSRAKGRKWATVRTMAYPGTGRKCLTTTAPAGTEFRWTDTLQQRWSNVVKAA